jgi:hypothetical protein
VSPTPWSAIPTDSRISHCEIVVHFTRKTRAKAYRRDLKRLGYDAIYRRAEAGGSVSIRGPFQLENWPALRLRLDPRRTKATK